jgi:YD repeat-containing protein
VRDSLNQPTSYQYDASGNRTRMTDRKGQEQTFTYDQANRLTSVIAGGQTITYSYDATGNRLTMADPTGTTTYQYDNLDRQTRATYPDGRAVQAAYDLAGNRTSLTNPGGITMQAFYDAANRLSQMAQGTLTWTDLPPFFGPVIRGLLPGLRCSPSLVQALPVQRHLLSGIREARSHEPPGCKRRRRPIAQARMRSRFVVLLAPCGELRARLPQVGKPVLVQAFVAQPAVEALDVGVLHRPSRGNEIEPNPPALGPRVKAQRGELRAIVEREDLRRPSLRDRSLQRADDRFGGESGGRRETDTFAAEVIDCRKDPKARPRRQLIGHEVDTPVLVRSGGQRWQDPQSGGELPAASDADCEPLFAIQS